MPILQVERLRSKEDAESRAGSRQNYAEDGIFLIWASRSEPVWRLQVSSVLPPPAAQGRAERPPFPGSPSSGPYFSSFLTFVFIKLARSWFHSFSIMSFSKLI